MKTKGYHYNDADGTCASAVHASTDDGKHQAVGINLRVVILPEGKSWYAQGLEIDYGAQGETLEKAKEHFENGLAGTVKLHIEKYGNIERLLCRAGADAWQDAWEHNSNIERFMQVSFHSIDATNATYFPYPVVEYFRPKAA